MSPKKEPFAKRKWVIWNQPSWLDSGKYRVYSGSETSTFYITSTQILFGGLCQQTMDPVFPFSIQDFMVLMFTTVPLQSCRWFPALPQMIPSFASNDSQLCLKWFPALPQMIPSFASNDSQLCLKWFTALPQMIPSFASNDSQLCLKWFPALPQMIPSFASNDSQLCLKWFTALTRTRKTWKKHKAFSKVDVFSVEEQISTP